MQYKRFVHIDCGLGAKERIFNKLLTITLYVQYVHLAKAKHIHKRQPTFSSERMSHKDYDCKGSAEKKMWFVSLNTNVAVINHL
jgi:hypothetical protein